MILKLDRGTSIFLQSEFKHFRSSGQLTCLLLWCQQLKLCEHFRRILWLRNGDPVKGCFAKFPSITMHAISQEPQPCIYAQLEAANSNSDEEQSEELYPEIRLFPAESDQREFPRHSCRLQNMLQLTLAAVLQCRRCLKPCASVQLLILTAMMLVSQSYSLLRTCKALAALTFPLRNQHFGH